MVYQVQCLKYLAAWPGVNGRSEPVMLYFDACFNVTY